MKNKIVFVDRKTKVNKDIKKLRKILTLEPVPTIKVHFFHRWRQYF